MLAVSTGDLDLVSTMLEHDARVEDADKDGRTSYQYIINKNKVDAMKAKVDLHMNDIFSVDDDGFAAKV